MRRSTWTASGPWLRRAVIFLLPLLAVCALASPGEANARSRRPGGQDGVSSRRADERGGAPSQAAGAGSRAATEQAIAGVLAESTGLNPSQVTSESECPSAGPGFARCDAEALVLRSGHAHVRPNVHGGPTFTQVFPHGRRGIPSARPADASGAAPPEPGHPGLAATGLRPDLPLADRRRWGHGGDRRRRRGPERRGGLGSVPERVRIAGVHDRERLLQAGQRERGTPRRSPRRTPAGSPRRRSTSTRCRRCARTASWCSWRPRAPPTATSTRP